MNARFVPLSAGLPALDGVLKGLMPGDNVVWQVDSIGDYIPFVEPFIKDAIRNHRKLIYFRFSKHPPLMEGNASGVEIHTMDPSAGFENFISAIFDVIEKTGKGAYYLFDNLSDLAADWFSDRMLSNFFSLTCPYLYDYETVSYFALLRNRHSVHATEGIYEKAQIILDVYRGPEKLFLHPIKVYKRYSSTMYMLHAWEGESFKPVTNSATISSILSGVTQPWVDFSIHRLGVWTQTCAQAQEAMESSGKGGRQPAEAKAFFQRLLRMLFTRDEKMLALAGKHLSLAELLEIRKRMIGTGLIGGKAVGMIIARAILGKTDRKWAGRLEPHDSFYIGSDVFYTYLVQNGCWWVRRKQRRKETLLEGADEARRRLLSGSFPRYIQEQFLEMLNYFGQSPIIVRSSSLLEDNYGNSFSGKYQSVFCANQGTPQDRLEDFVSAVRKVYASTMSSEALLYRSSRGLLENDEQMALLVQRVSGDMHSTAFFPAAAGVGYSFNPYAWSPDIDPRAGMLRLVFGLGTRAVDRYDDDYTRIVAVDAPGIRPESNADEARKFTQRRMDVLDMRTNQLSSADFEDVAKIVPDGILSMVATQDEETLKRAREAGLENVFAWKLTFDSLLSETSFAPEMREMLRVLEEAYRHPVDVEFTLNFLEDASYRINLVQCRPFHARASGKPVALPADIKSNDIVFRTSGPIIGPSLDIMVDRLIFVDPAVYANLGMSDRYSVARLIGQLTHPEGRNRPERMMLIGPGRWGTSTPSLGVPVNFAEINTATVLCEIMAMHEGLVPDLSLGTHFFNDIVECNMIYLAVAPQRKGSVFNAELLRKLPNRLAELAGELPAWGAAVRVFDAGSAGRGAKSGKGLRLNANSVNPAAVCFMANE